MATGAGGAGRGRPPGGSRASAGRGRLEPVWPEVGVVPWLPLRRATCAAGRNWRKQQNGGGGGRGSFPSREGSPGALEPVGPIKGGGTRRARRTRGVGCGRRGALPSCPAASPRWDTNNRAGPWSPGPRHPRGSLRRIRMKQPACFPVTVPGFRGFVGVFCFGGRWGFLSLRLQLSAN